MRRGRKTFIVLAVLVVSIAAVLILVLTNIDSIVKAAIEKYGSKVTQTPVRVSSVKIKLAAGEGAISGISIGNPSGFSAPHAFSLGMISVKIDTGTVTKNLVVIDKVLISAPQVTYEINDSGVSNINALKKNIRQATGGTAKKAPEAKKAGGKEVKFLIRKLVVDKGKVNVRIAALQEKPMSSKLPRLELANIGKGAGATPAQIAEQVLSALIKQVGPAVASLGVDKYIGKTAEELRQKVSEEVGKPLSGAAEEAEDTVKKLFGK